MKKDKDSLRQLTLMNNANPNSLSRLYLEARAAGCPKDQLARFNDLAYVPFPKQLRFHAAARACDHPNGPTQLGFGGARGPGKSHASFAQLALDDCQRQPGLKALYLRKHAKQAREQFDDLRRKLLRKTDHKYDRSSAVLTFPNDSRIVIGHIRTEYDIDLYLGLEYDVILIEEATSLSETKYRALRDSNRTSGIFRPRIYSTANPGGIGHSWYKKNFVDPHRQQQESDTRFIPATVDDNVAIDQDYRRKLEENTGWKLRAHRYGDWEIAAGQFLDNFRYDIHVIKPFKTPQEWWYWLAMDHGYSHPTVLLLLVEDDDDNIYVLDEHVQARWLPQQHAAAVRNMMERNNVPAGPLEEIWAGPDVFAQRSEITIADRYHDEGLRLEPAQTDRIQGANEIRTRLGDVDNGIPPTLFIFDRCRRLIECLPSLQNDPRRPEDVLKTNVNEEGQGGDDTYDALRYALTARRRIQPSFCSLPPPDPIKEADLGNYGSDWDSDWDDIRKLRF